MKLTFFLKASKIIYLCLAPLIIPLATIGAYVVHNTHARWQVNENLSKALAKRMGGIKYVFCGDSITAGGLNFGWRLDRHPFNSINMGQSGQTLRQTLRVCSRRSQTQTGMDMPDGGNKRC